MAKKPLLFRAGGNYDSKSIFMRERLILNVANLRYEFELIAILTPLPPARRSELTVLPPSTPKRKRSPSSKQLEPGKVKNRAGIRPKHHRYPTIDIRSFFKTRQNSTR